MARIDVEIENGSFVGEDVFGYSVKYNAGMVGGVSFSFTANPLPENTFELKDHKRDRIGIVTGRKAADNALYQMAWDKATELQKTMTPEIKDLTIKLK